MREATRNLPGAPCRARIIFQLTIPAGWFLGRRLRRCRTTLISASSCSVATASRRASSPTRSARRPTRMSRISPARSRRSRPRLRPSRHVARSKETAMSRHVTLVSHGGPRRSPHYLAQLSMIVRRTPMNNTRVIGLTAAFVMASAGAEAFDESKYPDLKGQWERVGVPNWTPAGKPPLTPEYEAVYEANRADMRNGGAGNVPSQYCFPQGMPMMMNLYDPMEIA